MKKLTLAVAFTMLGLGCSSTGDGDPANGGGSGHGGQPAGGHGGGDDGTIVIPEPANHDLDVVFVVDNSSSMAMAQRNLIKNVPAFFETLKAFPGGMPNLHLAVVSSDMGAGSGTSGCASNGQAGIFQWGAPNAACAATTNGKKFLANIDGAANYTGDLSSVFSCIAALGEDGCGYEQTLLSVAHALGADNFDSNGNPQGPQENQGFLREGAYLAIIVLTNEDDCSSPGGAGSDFFPRSGDGSNLSARLGPPTSYRCNAFGHLCDGAAPPIKSPMGVNDPGDSTTLVTLQNCVSNEGPGYLLPVSTVSEAIKALKPDPANQILVAAISGLYPDGSRNTPYAVTWRTSPISDPAGPWPEVVHSCVSAGDQSFADPGVRIGEWVQQFGPNGVLQSICDASFGPALQRIGDEIGRLMRPRCVTGVFADKSPTQPGTQYDCTVTDQIGGANVPVPSCEESGGAHPCWHLDPDTDCRVPAGAPAGTAALRLKVDREGVVPSGLVSVSIRCAF